VFDIGFSEIVIIGVVALIVIGPERLPKVARTLGHMFGRLQRYVNEVKADINREMELDELRKLQSQVQSAARDIEQSVTHAAQSMESGVRSVEAQLNEAEKEPTKEPTKDPAAEASTLQPSSATKSASSATKTDAAEEGSRQPTLPGIDRI
jgi:sec-independent protein translocase protein TatB